MGRNPSCISIIQALLIYRHIGNKFIIEFIFCYYDTFRFAEDATHQTSLIDVGLNKAITMLTRELFS